MVCKIVLTKSLVVVVLLLVSSLARAQNVPLPKLAAVGAFSIKIGTTEYDSTWDGLNIPRVETKEATLSIDFAWPSHDAVYHNDSTMLGSSYQTGDTLILQVHKSYGFPHYGGDSCMLQAVIDTVHRIVHQLTILLAEQNSGDGGRSTSAGRIVLNEVPYTTTNDRLTTLSLNDSLKAATSFLSYSRTGTSDTGPDQQHPYTYTFSRWTLNGSNAGRFSLSLGTTSLLSVHLNELSTATLTVYPNPAHDHIRITLPTGSDASNIELSDLLGRTWLTTRHAPSETTLDVSIASLPAGLYAIRAGSFHGRFVKAD
jgi:hypothetical protein